MARTYLKPIGGWKNDANVKRSLTLYEHRWGGQLQVSWEQHLETKLLHFFARGEDTFLGQTVAKMFEMDFSEKTYGQSLSMSLEDKKALSIMEESLKVVDGHYQLDLPFRDKPALPNNRILAERLHSLGVRFRKDPDLYEKYKNGITNNVEKGYASKVHEIKNGDVQVEEGHTWYLPHHPVLHPQKPRIVFDCAAKYEDVPLNDRLLQGPDMTNTLIGVLSRFCLEPTAFMADIEVFRHDVLPGEGVPDTS